MRGLVDVAHRSLGYLISPTSSPFDDSVRAAWRSSSTIARTDIPDFPSPNPERPSPRRMRSAPEILKHSPPTPTARVIRGGTTLQTAHRLQDMMLHRDDENRSKAEGTLGVPRDTPARTKRLSSPLFSPSPKRREVDVEDRGMTSPPRITVGIDPTTPRRCTSLLPSIQSPRILLRVPLSAGDSMNSQSRQPILRISSKRSLLVNNSHRHTLKKRPLSLRTRIRLALRDSAPTAPSLF